MAFMAEAGARSNVVQVLGSDDPTGMAIATAYTPHALVGETMLATGAALAKRPSHIASLLVQNILRVLLIFGLLAFALLRFFA
jgi:CRP-like cAMP-binding protein